MTIEQKAKAYDKAIEKIKYVMDRGVEPILNKADLQSIFPELKESEDERIRKKVIEVLKLKINGAESQMQANRRVDRTFEVYACNKVIAWLEKQGEQKPAEWSEEDEKEVAILEAYIRSGDWSDSHINRALGIVYELTNRLKSLRPQNHWKPSEEQMLSLRQVISGCSYDIKPLLEIEEQLRKL